MSTEAAKVRRRFELTSSSAITIDSSCLLATYNSTSTSIGSSSISNSSSSSSSSSSDGSSSSRLNENWREIMNLFGEVGNLFIICKGTEDELKSSNITTMLDDIGFPKHRLLFCNTEKGKIAMVRQIVPRYVCMCALIQSIFTHRTCF